MNIRKVSDMYESFSMLYVLLVIFLVFALSVINQVELGLVFLAFSPTMAMVAISLILFEESKFIRIITWFIPFVLIGVFAFILTNMNLALAFDMDAIMRANLTLIFGYLLMSFGLSYLLTNFYAKTVTK